MWFWSAENGDFLFINRMIITLRVSINGTIKMAIATTGALFIMTYGMEDRSMNLMAIKAMRYPTTIEPVSPMKILYWSDILKYKNANKAPNTEIAKNPMEYSYNLKNINTKQSEIKIPTPLANPSIPSIKLYELIIRMMIKV